MTIFVCSKTVNWWANTAKKKQKIKEFSRWLLLGCRLKNYKIIYQRFLASVIEHHKISIELLQ